MHDQVLSQTIANIRHRLSDKYAKGEIDAFVRIIFRQLMRYEPVDILLHKDSVLSGFIVGKIDKVVDELLKNRPIQYIFGQTYFCGHTFKVDESTLIPRPETEELVDWIVDDNKKTDLRVLDCGTGSGCIAVSLALALKFAVVDAIDSVADKALLICNATASSARLVSSMGAACKTDLTQIRIAEFWKVEGDPLARALRQRFRRSGIFPKRKFSCAYSPQQVSNVRLAESEVTVNGAKRPNGTVVFATAAFGLALAGVIVNAVASATV